MAISTFRFEVNTSLFFFFKEKKKAAGFLKDYYDDK